MKGRDIKYLSGVADLARLDFEAAAVSVRGDDETLSAMYRGGYSGGWRSCYVPAVGNFEISISAPKFKAIASMFADDDDVGILAKDSELVLRSGNVTAAMQRWGEPTPETDVVPEDVAVLNPLMALRIPYNRLIEEVEIASGYVSDSNLRPVLTGIRFDVSTGRVDITAFDGFSLLFKSSIDARTHGSGSFVVPGVDFLLGMRLVNAEGDAILLRLRDTEKVLVYNQTPTTAYFNCALLAGTWPDLSRIENMELTGSEISLTPSQLRMLAVSGRAFDSRQVSLSGKNGRSSFDIASESGQFTSSVDAEINGTLHYDLDGFTKIAKLGERINLVIPPLPELPTLAYVDNRRCWISSRG